MREGLELREIVMEEATETGNAEKDDMNTVELQRILGYLNIGLAIAHDSGVSIGHFGCGDFIELAQTVNGKLLHSVVPASAAVPVGAVEGGPPRAAAGAALAA